MNYYNPLIQLLMPQYLSATHRILNQVLFIKNYWLILIKIKLLYYLIISGKYYKRIIYL